MTDVKLPPLPEKMRIAQETITRAGIYAYTEDQMHKYALSAVLKERERCAQVCISMAIDEIANVGSQCYYCADAIREGE